MNKLWFKRKKYGYGWVPATWEGWFVLVDYVVALCIIAWFTNDSLDTAVVPFLVVTVILLVVVYMTGETPRWQWGEDVRDTSARPLEKSQLQKDVQHRYGEDDTGTKK